MSQKQENDGETDAMAAIREAVEERQKAFGALDDGILDLDEVEVVGVDVREHCADLLHVRGRGGDGVGGAAVVRRLGRVGVA